jgi:hypothetical protein
MIFLLLVTVTSMVVAVIMGVIAWRIAGEEGRRSNARIAALAADIHAAPIVAPTRRADAGVPRRAEIGLRAEPARLASEPAQVSASHPWHDELELRPDAAVASNTDLFAAAQPARSGSRWAFIFLIGTLAVGSAAALAIVLSAGPRSVAHDKGAAPVAAPVPAPVPLELVALGHERDGDRLTVRGVVRNPAAGAEIDGITAVVFLFNRDGGFLASGRMPVESSSLQPGGETTFAVTVPGASDVGRYRVSFRTDDRIVPHVDRRKLEVKS